MSERGGRGERSGRGRGRARGARGRGERGAPSQGPQRGPTRSVRALAAGIVRGVLAGRGAARAHLERAVARGIEPRDRRLLTELVYGTIRHVGTLDLLLAACAKRGLGRVDEEVLATLRVGAYQLVFDERLHPGVVVDEAVEATSGRAHLRGFVNGVLRGLERKLAGRAAEDAPPEGVPSTRRLPGRAGGWVLLGEDLLPSAEADPAGWLAAACSLPLLHARALVERLGPEGALAVARAHNAPPPVFLRVNRLRTTREALLAKLAAAGLPASPGALPDSIRLEGSLGEGAHEALWAGEATVQDETAMRAARLLDPQPGERIVDLCAAPGGKATYAAELLGDRGRVDAVDVDERRLARVREAAARLGLGAVRPHLADPADPRPPEDEAPIDRVLVDVPCSNTGVLRRRVEARWRLPELDPVPLRALQARLLERAAELVRPGGVVVYSTCSIEPAEDEEQVRALLARRPDLELVEEVATLPQVGGGDGGYAAKLRRR